MKKLLRHGYTTGACAAAAAKGAALMLARQEVFDKVTIHLPTGESVSFQLHGQTITPDEAVCFVIKDAGDDPDVTNGAEVHALVRLNPPQPPFTKGGSSTILIAGGIGIGKVTKPGLAVPPGEWAINPVPRRMIAEAVQSAFSKLKTQNSKFKINVIISIPDGELRAHKTLNARLGIMGGLSILGTTGIVRPISAKAWTDTIDAALNVARACGCSTVVLSTGRTSEMAAQNFLRVRGQGSGVRENKAGTTLTHDPVPLTHDPATLPLPEEAFIMMGDHVAYALQACLQRGFNRPIIACQFAKLLKIACGYPNTHAAASELDLASLLKWATEHGLPGQLVDLIAGANTAREIIIASAFDPALLDLVCRHAHQAARDHAPGVAPSFLAADYCGTIVYCS